MSQASEPAEICLDIFDNEMTNEYNKSDSELLIGAPWWRINNDKNVYMSGNLKIQIAERKTAPWNHTYRLLYPFLTDVK